MNSAWYFPFIASAGILQAAGAAGNGALDNGLVGPWRAPLGGIVGATAVSAGVTPIARF